MHRTGCRFALCALLAAFFAVLSAAPAGATDSTVGCGASPSEPASCDYDHDGASDEIDNCRTVANGNQANNDGDAEGDVCDSDDDNDGVGDGTDNCPTTANSDQANYDGDSQGDACDPDDDNDGVPDTSDNCPGLATSNTADNDGDGQGDPCDLDNDNDGVPDTSDNCQLAPNPDQANNDGDGSGDACDADDDNDGVSDQWYRVCHWVDGNGDGDFTDEFDRQDCSNGNRCDPQAKPSPRSCDPLYVGHQFYAGQVSDNCDTVSNPDQANSDGDAQGDACDTDDDNDSVADSGDNCPRDANASQADADGDGRGAACDPDGDSPQTSSTTTTTTSTITTTTTSQTAADVGAGGSESPQEPTAPDVTPPIASLVVPRAKLGIVLRKGLGLTLTTNERGPSVLELVVAGRLAKRLGLSKGKAVVIARRTVTAAAGKTPVRLTLAAAAKRRLAHVRTLAVTLRASVTDAAGNVSKPAKRLTL